MGKRTLLTLAIITALAFVVRLVSNPGVPPGFSEQEAAIGVAAYQLLRGEEMVGLSWLSVFLTLPSVAIFGLTELAVRLPPVILGTLTVPLLYLLAKELLPRGLATHHSSLITHHLAPLLPSLLLALSPWHSQLSRAFLPATSALFFLILGLWFVLAKEKKNLALGLLFFLFSLASHPAGWFFVVPLLTFVFWQNQPVFLRQKAYLAFFALVSLLLIFYQSPLVKEFYLDTSFLSDPGFVNRINQLRGYHLQASLPLMGQLLYNKPVNFLETLARNYLSSFDWYYLFSHSFREETFFVWRFGKFAFVTLPFAAFGLAALLQKRQRFASLLLAWTFLAPLPGVLRNQPDFPQTLFFLIPAFLLMVAVGFFFLFDLLSRWKLLVQALVGLAVLVYGLSFTTFFHYFLIHYPAQSFRGWRFGYREAVPLIQAMSESYNKVILTDRLGGDPEIFYLFYTGLPVKAEQLDKFEFRSIDWEKENRSPGTLFVGTAEDIPEDYQRQPVIFYPDGSPALFFVGVPKK